MFVKRRKWFSGSSAAADLPIRPERFFSPSIGEPEITLLLFCWDSGAASAPSVAITPWRVATG